MVNPQSADVFVVGSGVAGAIVAHQMAPAGKSVIILEAGPRIRARTFDHPNLFIASSATMPTVGTVNVTLTIAALALRIADQLKTEV